MNERLPLAGALFGAAMLAAGTAWAGATQAQADPADLAFWNSIANSKNPAEYRAYLETFPNGRFAPLARVRAGIATPPAAIATPPAAAAPSPAAPGPAATLGAPRTTSPEPAGLGAPALLKSLLGAVKRGAAGEEPASPAAPDKIVAGSAEAGGFQVEKPEFRAIEGVAFDYDLSKLPPGRSYRVHVVPAGTPAALPDRFTLETNSLFLKPPKGKARTAQLAPAKYEARLYYQPEGRDDYQLAATRQFMVMAMRPGRIDAGRLLTEYATKGEVPFLATYKGRPVEIEGLFREAKTSGEQITITLGPADGGKADGVITCTASLSNNDFLQAAAAMTKGRPIAIQGLLSIGASSAKSIAFSPCVASPDPDVTFVSEEQKAPAAESATSAPASPPAPTRQAAANPPAPARQTGANQPAPAPTPAPAVVQPSATPPAGTRVAEIPKPPPAPRDDAGAKTLGLASLRFPQGRPAPATQPYLADFMKEVTAKNKAACDGPQAYQWDTAGWDSARFTQTVQSVIDDLKNQGYATKRLQKPYDNTLVLRVENPQPDPGDQPLLLAFYIEDDKDLFLIACTTK